MLTRLALASAAVFIVTAAAAVLAAPGQFTARPGEATEGKVSVLNRGRNQAIPVVIQETATVVVQNPPQSPIAVRLVAVGGEAAFAPPIVATRLVSQRWEYRTLSPRADQDLAAQLTALGNESWELTGQQAPGGTGVLIFKRPRP